MADAGSVDDRLPWIENPRPAARKRSASARRARTPLLLLLGLIMAGTVAVMAFLAGRGSGPIASQADFGEAPAVAVEPTAVPPPAVLLPPEPAPVVTPAPAPSPSVANSAAAPSQPATASKPAKAKPKTKARPVARTDGVQIHRNRRQAQTAPRRYRWPVPSAQPSGRVVQLGAYYSGRQTMAAWRRLRRAYPYLSTLPRKVTIVRPGPGHPLYYRLRIGTQSEGHARAICDNLHRIGRGCTVV